jgi:threonine/homoserine/homoserine lactone efflux protein
VSPHDTHPVSTMVALSGVFMAMTFVVFVGYGLLASVVREQIVSRPGAMSWMRGTFAGAFVVLAARLALAGR